MVRKQLEIRLSLSHEGITFCAVWLCLLLTWFVLELHVPVVQDCPCQFVNPHSLIGAEAQNVDGCLHTR